MSDAAKILALHRALCAAIGNPEFKLTMSDERAWSDFLGVISSLDETSGGPLTPRDMKLVIERMRTQVASGKAGWSLRYTKILRDPETFRDLVLEVRKKFRPRAAIERVTRTLPDGANVIDERDPAAEADATNIRAAAKTEMARFKAQMTGGKA